MFASAAGDVQLGGLDLTLAVGAAVNRAGRAGEVADARVAPGAEVFGDVEDADSGRGDAGTGHHEVQVAVTVGVDRLEKDDPAGGCRAVRGPCRAARSPDLGFPALARGVRCRPPALCRSLLLGRRGGHAAPTAAGEDDRCHHSDEAGHATIVAPRGANP